MPPRPSYYNPDGSFPSAAWIESYQFEFNRGGKLTHKYCPTPKGLDFHESTTLNCILAGSRGTGKSTIIRNDAHMRSWIYPGFTYLVLRRTMRELKLSHLKFIEGEMLAMGGAFMKTDSQAEYPNGSIGFYSHCEDEAAVLKLLSSEFACIYFDEISTFTWDQITKVGACARVPEGSGLMALIRGGTNPIGPGASEVRRHYITKDITPEEDPEYIPGDYEEIHTTLDDNPYIDRKQYIKRLSTLPEHIRRAWLDGEWIIEGAYFHDYMPTRKGEPWHVTEVFPTWKDAQTGNLESILDYHWIQIYRALDWGFSPDPSVCLWIAVLPNGQAVVFKERSWLSTPAWKVAEDIRVESVGMDIVETFCDPTMFYNDEATDHQSIGNIFELNEVALTKSKNDRAMAGFKIHEWLNSTTTDATTKREVPKLQIYGPACHMLTRTFPEMRIHKTDARKIADGNDHWVISLAYFCIGWTITSQVPKEADETPRWLREAIAAQADRPVLGSEGVRSSQGRTGRL